MHELLVHFDEVEQRVEQQEDLEDAGGEDAGGEDAGGEEAGDDQDEFQDTESDEESEEE